MILGRVRKHTGKVTGETSRASETALFVKHSFVKRFEIKPVDFSNIPVAENFTVVYQHRGIR